MANGKRLKIERIGLQIRGRIRKNSATGVTAGFSKSECHMTSSERFAERIFFWAGVYGLVLLVPQYFLEAQVGRDYPPPIAHPEYFYGFIGVALAWQMGFLIISRDPQRFRPLMWAGVAEKFLFAAPTFVLLAKSRAPAVIGMFAGIDLLLGGLFVVAYYRVGRERSP